jgi:hypothetical protein
MEEGRQMMDGHAILYAYYFADHPTCTKKGILASFKNEQRVVYEVFAQCEGVHDTYSVMKKYVVRVLSFSLIRKCTAAMSPCRYTSRLPTHV